jgi:uncharacterized damage-inducible protein DinB
MDKKENLRYLLESNHGAVRRLIDDVSDEESMFRGKDNLNHIRWHTGHIAYCANIVLRLMGEEGAFPEPWEKLFGGGSEINDKPSAYPSMPELREKLYSIYDQTDKALDKISTDDLDREIEAGSDRKITPMNGALFFCAHEFYHCGQIANLRKILGREPLFR